MASAKPARQARAVASGAFDSYLAKLAIGSCPANQLDKAAQGRRDRASTPLPVLVLTAAENGQRWAEEIGAAGCVTKPFDVQDLLAEVERLLPPG
jgi:DNA-binding response OmpR family regulator